MSTYERPRIDGGHRIANRFYEDPATPWQVWEAVHFLEAEQERWERYRQEVNAKRWERKHKKG